MNVYMFAESDDIDDVRDSLAKELLRWAEQKTTIAFINRDHEGAEKPKSRRSLELGIELVAGKDKKLKEPLNTLYKLSKTFKCDFVVGVFDDDGYQDVCYFGNQEGRPDMYEIANYLGMSD